MPTDYGKSAKAKATKLHSLYVRTRDNFTCRWCGTTKESGKQIQCAHIISRSISATRTDERNAVALCASCHWKQTKNPLVWARWIEQELGKDWLDDLLERGVSGVKVDWQDEVVRLESALDQITKKAQNSHMNIANRNMPISPMEVESELIRITQEIESETEAFETLAKDHAVKEAEYKKSWFKEYLAAEGAVKNKESWAGYKTSDLYYDTQVAEALVKAKREKLHSLRTACDALRTIAANVRNQVKF